MRRFVILISILISFVLADKRTDNPLYGLWHYDSFTDGKFRTVSGTLSVSDSTITFDGEIHEDHPTSPQKSTIPCTLSGGVCHYDFEIYSKMPLSRYYLILDSVIYFSWNPISIPVRSYNPHLGRESANYSYSARFIE